MVTTRIGWEMGPLDPRRTAATKLTWASLFEWDSSHDR